LLWPNNFPIVTSRDQLHLTPRPPPVVYFSGTSIPYFFPRNHFAETIQKGFINIARPTINQIIGMRNKTHQSVSASELRQLLFPLVTRIVVYNVLAGIILHPGQWEF